MPYRKSFSLIIFQLITVASLAQKTTVTEGVYYNKKKNCTNYFVMPYGTVSIPGKWEKGRQSSVSYQQYFKNEKDSVTIAISFGSYKSFGFNLKGNLKGFDFVKKYYEWDSQYLTNNTGLQREIIKEDSLNNYIIWQLRGNTHGVDVDQLFLFGIKNKNISDFMINTQKWNIDTKVSFLENLFLSK